MKRLLFSAVFISLVFLFKGVLLSSTLNIDSDYRMRGISYTNNDFDKSTSTDSVSYYSQKFNLSISGRFNEDIEIGSRITALGIAGSTTTPFSVPNYPNTNFSPYIETAYLKIYNFSDLPLNLTIGKQNLDLRDGMIISDNGIGFNAFRFEGKYDFRLPFTNYILPISGDGFMAKISDGLMPDQDHDLYGGMGAVVWKQHLWEFGYYEDRDLSGSKYIRGSNEADTKIIVKKYYDLCFSKDLTDAKYSVEFVKQKGYVERADGHHISLNGYSYKFFGQLIGDKTKLGRVKATSFLHVSSGDDDPLSIDDSNEAFTPTTMKTFDGLEPKGYGMLFSANPMGSFFELPELYSGINTLNLGADFSPWYAWTFGVDYYLYSASKGVGLQNASGFERLFGANYSLGIEMDLKASFEYSKYSSFSLAYSRYTPPSSFALYWPQRNPATMYQFEINAKF